jgi:hypothetical protein
MKNESIAGKIRSIVERRVAQALECKPNELPLLKLSTLLHFIFLLKGDSEELGGFHTSLVAAYAACLVLIGLMWFGGYWESRKNPDKPGRACLAWLWASLVTSGRFLEVRS